MLSILKLDSILLTLLSTVIRVSFPLSLSQKGICSSIVYHKTLHLYYKFPYYEERTHNLLRYHYRSTLPLITFQVLTTQTYHFSYHFSYHCDTIFCDTLRGFFRTGLCILFFQQSRYFKPAAISPGNTQYLVASRH